MSRGMSSCQIQVACPSELLRIELGELEEAPAMTIAFNYADASSSFLDLRNAG